MRNPYSPPKKRKTKNNNWRNASFFILCLSSSSTAMMFWLALASLPLTRASIVDSSECSKDELALWIICPPKFIYVLRYSAIEFSKIVSLHGLNAGNARTNKRLFMWIWQKENANARANVGNFHRQIMFTGNRAHSIQHMFYLFCSSFLSVFKFSKWNIEQKSFLIGERGWQGLISRRRFYPMRNEIDWVQRVSYSLNFDIIRNSTYDCSWRFCRCTGSHWYS